MVDPNVAKITGFVVGSAFTAAVGFLGWMLYRIVTGKIGEEPEEQIEITVGMPLLNARLCLDCDLVFSTSRSNGCPSCTSSVWVYINHWLAVPDELKDIKTGFGFDFEAVGDATVEVMKAQEKPISPVMSGTINVKEVS